MDNKFSGYCQHCGAKVGRFESKCPECGADLRKQKNHSSNRNKKTYLDEDRNRTKIEHNLGRKNTAKIKKEKDDQWIRGFLEDKTLDENMDKKQKEENVIHKTTENKQLQNDKGGPVWTLLGCCIPIVGIILWLIWKDTKPVTAKSVGYGALAIIILWVAFYFSIMFFGIYMY